MLYVSTCGCSWFCLAGGVSKDPLLTLARLGEGCGWGLISHGYNYFMVKRIISLCYYNHKDSGHNIFDRYPTYNQFSNYVGFPSKNNWILLIFPDETTKSKNSFAFISFFHQNLNYLVV